MAEEKKYYWIKLTLSFLTSDAVDFLMGQKNGSEYVVLYQMLCLKTINTNGELARQIGEVIIQYDPPKIQRDTKYFSLDTVIVALELYKKLGLVYTQENGTLKITDFEKLVGSETKWAGYKRENKKKDLEIFQSDSNFSPKKVHTEIEIRDRDKRIEKDNRERDKERDNSDIKNNVMSVKTDPASTVDYQKILNYWNEHSLLKELKAITPKRKQHLSIRIKEYGLENIFKVIDNVNRSPFMRGENNKNWTATFDWVFGSPNNFIKVLEGNYINGGSKKDTTMDILSELYQEYQDKEQNDG